MRLFTPLSSTEADQAERGALHGDFVWVTEPVPEDAEADTVWVAIEIPDNRMAKFEKQVDPKLGHREFLVPSRVTNLHHARRVDPPL